MSNFEIGKTYSTRSACDHDCIISITVTARTAKTVRGLNRHGQPTNNFRVFSCDGHEAIRPWGRGSMMPIIDASKVS